MQDTRHPTSDTRHQSHNTKHQTSYIRYPALGTRHQTHTSVKEAPSIPVASQDTSLLPRHCHELYGHYPIKPSSGVGCHGFESSTTQALNSSCPSKLNLTLRDLNPRSPLTRIQIERLNPSLISPSGCHQRQHGCRLSKDNLWDRIYR